MLVYLVILIVFIHLENVAGESDRMHAIMSGSIDGFMSLSEAEQLLSTLVDTYPSLITKQVIGNSVEGREIQAYKVSACPLTNAPKLLMTSLMHAREPLSLSVSLYIISRLASEYEDGDIDVRYLLETRELYVVPIVNPDGYSKLTHTTGLRKNGRNTCPSDPTNSGVDLNRNFAFDWRPVSNECSEEYSGRGPFSEPETIAIRDLSIAKNFTSAIHFHSFGDILTIPYNGGDGKKQVDPVHMQFYQDIQAAWKFETFGPSIQTLNYTTSGESDDWLYDELGTLSMSPELGPERSGFRPSATEAERIILDIYPKVKVWMMRAGGPQIDNVMIESSSESSEWTVTLENRGLVALNESVIVIDDGGVCEKCDDTNSCELTLQGRARVYRKATSMAGALGGVTKMNVPQCPREAKLRSESLNVCIIQSFLNCRCFLGIRPGVSTSFPIDEISNHASNIPLCTTGGVYSLQTPTRIGQLRFVAMLFLIGLVVIFLSRIVLGLIRKDNPTTELDSAELFPITSTSKT